MVRKPSPGEMIATSANQIVPSKLQKCCTIVTRPSFTFGGLEGGLGPTFALGGLEGGLGPTFALGGLEGGLGLTFTLGGLEGGLGLTTCACALCTINKV